MIERGLLCLLLVILLLPARAVGEPEPPEDKAGSAPPPTEPAAGDPFARLKPVVARNKLGPIVSVRIRDKREAADRSRKGTITVSVSTAPKGASVYYGGKLLGTTPIGLTAQRGSTPFDVVIRRGGYMTLHTRLMRKVSRGYFFKLSPAKLH